MTLGIGFAFAALAKAAATKADDGAKKWKIVPEYEQRERMERRTNKAFNHSIDDNRTDLYTRLRPGFKFSYGADVSGEVIYQYAHDLWWAKSGNASTDNSDLLIGYAGVKTDDGFWSAGRERLKKGNERLIGESGWNNLSNSWDVLRFQGGPLDVFGGKMGVYQSDSQNIRILGGSYDSGFGETMLLLTGDNTKGVATQDYTLDHLYKGDYGNLHGEFEGVYQMGSKNTVLYRSWALSGRITEKLTKRWNVSVESNAASGGTQRNGTDTSFNNLYPTNHFFYGNEDLQGWSNMGEIDLESSYKVDPKVKLTAEAHHFFLHDASDAWYGNSGAANKYGSTTYVNPSGSFGKDLGEEFSLDCQWDISKQMQFMTGIADFQPGRFVQSFVNTGYAVQQLWFYTQVNIKF